MKQPRPRKHHYLPQFYLKGFSQNGSHFNQIEKRTGETFGVRVADSAAIRDFHTLDFEGCVDPEALEKLVSRVESDIAPALEEVVATRVLTLKGRTEIDRLVSMLMTRVPASKEIVDRSLREAVRSVGEVLQRQGRLPKLPTGFEEALSFEQLEIQIYNWRIMDHMFSLAFDRDILQVLGRLTAELITAPEGKQFITSDQPVALFNADARPEDVNRRGGLADPNIVLTLPLSAHLVLRLYYGLPSRELRVATVDEVDEINRRTIVMATERLFAMSPDVSIAALLSRCGHCNAGSQLAVRRNGNGASLQVMSEQPVMDRRLYEPLGAANMYVPLRARLPELRNNRGAVYPVITRYIPLDK